MSEDFATYIDSERSRLENERRVLNEYIAAHQHQLDAINDEFAAIEAYEEAKTGKVAARASETPPRTRRRNGSLREEVLNTIRGFSGMKRGEILERMGRKGDKSSEMSVSNALTALTQAGQLVRKDGRYHASAPAIPSAEDVRVVLRAAAE